MKKPRYFYQDHEISEDEAFDNDILKDGVRMVSSVMLMDSAGNMLVDALGRPISAGHHGYAFADADAKRRIEDRAYAKAELSSRWKGGLQDGDHVTIGDRRLEVTGRNPENNKLVLSDTAQLDGDEVKREAYDEVSRCWPWPGEHAPQMSKLAVRARLRKVSRANGQKGLMAHWSVDQLRTSLFPMSGRLPVHFPTVT